MSSDGFRKYFGLSVSWLIRSIGFPGVVALVRVELPRQLPAEAPEPDGQRQDRHRRQRDRRSPQAGPTSCRRVDRRRVLH